MRLRRGRVAALPLAVFIAAVLAPGISQAQGCASPTHEAGQWTSFGSDIQGTRSQPLEQTISPDNVGTLTPKWTFSVTAAGGAGDIPGMPLEAEGCVYIYTTIGWVYALNADDGSLVWSRQVGVVNPATPAIADGLLYLSQSTTADREGLHAIALDAHTGEIVLVSDAVATDDPRADTSAVYFDGLVILGVHNSETGHANTGGFGLVDAATGAVLKRTYTVPADEAGTGGYAGVHIDGAEELGLGTFAGCTVWSVTAVDPATKYGYVGTAQPGNQPGAWLPGNESDLCNAIIKFDLDRSRPTFGEIVGWRKGNLDEPPYLDVDFGGGGATLLRDAEGRQIVVQLQKSGWLHAAYTSSMRAAWSTVLGYGLSNYSAQATDGANVFVVGVHPSNMFSINGTTGEYNWVTPVTSPSVTNPVAYANGVVYYANDLGVLNAYDAGTGLPLLARSIAGDAPGGGCTRNQSGGVSIARNTVLAACGPVVAAYELPGA